MRPLLILLVLVVAGALLLGLWILDDPGYVLVIREGWQLETSLGFATLLLLFAAFAVAALTLVGAALWDMLSPFGATYRSRSLLARQRLRRGFRALVEGHWERAEKLLRRTASARPWRIMAALGAAQAAAEQGDDAAMNAHLAVAEQDRVGRLAAGLLAARVALDREQPAQARERLLPLREGWPKHPRVMQLLAEADARLGNWQELTDVLAALRRVRPDTWRLAALEQQAWHGLLRQTAETVATADPQQRLGSLRALWKRMPSHLHHEPALRAGYAGYLAQFGDGEAALSLIDKGLEERWDDRLAAVCESITDLPPERLLVRLEQWLAPRPDNGSLLLTAGRVALRAQLWGKARAFFEQAGDAGNATALAELARLLAALEDQEQALATLDRRQRLIDGPLPELPLPSRRAAS